MDSVLVKGLLVAVWDPESSVPESVHRGFHTLGYCWGCGVVRETWMDANLDFESLVDWSVQGRDGWGVLLVSLACSEGQIPVLLEVEMEHRSNQVMMTGELSALLSDREISLDV